MNRRRRRTSAAAVAIALGVALAGCAPAVENGATVSLPAVVPAPASIEARHGAPFRLDDADPHRREIRMPPPPSRRSSDARTGLAIDASARLGTDAADRARSQPGRRGGVVPDHVDAASVVVTGADAAGLFYGVQTLGQLIARDGDGWIDPGRRDRGRAALRLPRRDARRRPPLPPGRDGQGLHRPRGEPQVQRAAPAPHRRPGLAHPARLAAGAHRARVRHVGRRRPGRLLHEGRLPRDRRVRGIPSHDRRARDRHARPHPRGRARVSGARRGAGAERPHARDRARRRRRGSRRGRPVRRHGGRLLVAEDPRRGDLRLRRRRASASSPR